MAILLSIYIFLFLAIAVYAGINIYHLVKFRLGFRGDKTSFTISVYLILILLILAVSWLGAFTALQPVAS